MHRRQPVAASPPPWSPTDGAHEERKGKGASDHAPVIVELTW